jgi:hypothetical protein
MLGQHPVVNKLLLEMGCDVNAVDDEGNTVLMRLLQVRPIHAKDYSLSLKSFQLFSTPPYCCNPRVCNKKGVKLIDCCLDYKGRASKSYSHVDEKNLFSTALKYCKSYEVDVEDSKAIA